MAAVQGQKIAEEPGHGQAQRIVVRLAGIKKAFGQTPVLRGIDLEATAGEVLMLVGENGAGKSTLKNIVCGVLAPDSGTITINGENRPRLTGREAEALGIGVIHQELSLFPNLTVTENIFIGHLRRHFLPVGWPSLRRRARALLGDVLAADIDPDARVEALSIGQRQLVEIAKAINGSSRVLVLDEPTTCLTLPERTRLFEVVRRLGRQGLAILYITHFMDEVYSLGDRIVVLRDGRNVGEGTPAEIDRRRLGILMAGREIAADRRDLQPVVDEARPRLAVTGISDDGLLRDVSFSVRRGEILGLAGLVGSGRSEVAEALVGLRPVTSGRIEIDGIDFDRRTPAAALSRGLVLVSEDRRRDQAFLGRPVRENLTVAVLGRLAGRLGLIPPSAERAAAADMVRRFSVIRPSDEAPMSALSGGNQQKAIIGRWIGAEPRVSVLDEPTKGVDIGARELIHRLIRDLAGDGLAVLLISSDLPELFTLCHRIAVLHKGRLVAELDPAEVDAAAVVELASSGRVEDAGAAP